jgi:hypothetical protein
MATASYVLYVMYASALPGVQPTMYAPEAVLRLSCCTAAVKGCAGQSEPCRISLSSTLACMRLWQDVSDGLTQL